MILQIDLIQFTIITPLIEIIIIAILLVAMIYSYQKFHKITSFLIMMVNFLISIIIGVQSILNNLLPFTPYIQLFFILTQLSLFILKINNPT